MDDPRDGQNEKPQNPKREDREPANSAPDAVKDPNEKTDGQPGVPPGQGDEADPGAG
ncbi:hypothetical protein [Methylobacterium sp. Leaf118]|uniref:hypothetical protein n=1 Tax=Methylobacterium sp. Leaf118 TaxID=2876562 RepID=UPI001E3F4165|nr:hypothetical protein [Methylobacterium sp. Leaf118]